MYFILLFAYTRNSEENMLELLNEEVEIDREINGEGRFIMKRRT
jgi:hypothetical protein